MLVKNFLTYINESQSNSIYYHGSNNKFDAFDLTNNKLYREIDLPVWFFVNNIEYAKRFGEHIYKVRLSINKTFDTLKPDHFKMFMEYLKNDERKSNEEIDIILDDQFYKGLPYWTCDDSYYAAISNGFDSILIQEELEGEVIAVGVFNINNIEIIH